MITNIPQGIIHNNRTHPVAPYIIDLSKIFRLEFQHSKWPLPKGQPMLECLRTHNALTHCKHKCNPSYHTLAAGCNGVNVGFGNDGDQSHSIRCVVAAHGQGFFHMEAVGKKKAAGIHSIDLEINKGTILGLIGPNGAGKNNLDEGDLWVVRL